MDQVLSDSKLRIQLIERGKDRVRKFFWTKTDEKTLEIYKEVSNSV